VRAHVFLAILACVAARVATAADIMTIPAVDKALYPDLLGFGYNGPFADIVWFGRIAPLLNGEGLSSVLNECRGGLSGELVRDRFDLPSTNLTSTSEFTKNMARSFESHRFVAQYLFTFYDYAGKISDAFSRHNAEEQRLQTAAQAAAALDASLRQVIVTQPSAGPAPLPARSVPYVGKVTYYSDALLAAKRARLTEAGAALAAAVAARDVDAYDKAFSQLDHFTEDARLKDDALLAFEYTHTNKILRGQPLDGVVAAVIHLTQNGPDWLDFEQVKLVNKINLFANVVSDWRPLVGAMMLIADDYTAGQVDGTLSMALIWQHATDLTWIVDKIVQVRNNGSTAQLVRDEIDAIIERL
jgi:hypothetical protein